MAIYWDRPCYKCRSHTCDMSCPEPDHLAKLAKRDAEIAELTDSHSEYMHQYTSAYNQQAHNYRHLQSKFSEHLKQHTKDLDDASDALENAAKEVDALKAEVEQLTKKYEALQQAYGLLHGGSK